MPLLEGVNLSGLIIALALPWLCGAALLGAFLPRPRPMIVFGHGYMVGQLLVILILLALDAVGAGVSFLPVAAILIMILLASAAIWWRRSAGIGLPTPGRDVLWHLLWLLPLAWFAFERGSVLASELMLRPLYAWDAWMNWVPRAVVWFEHGQLTPFVSPAQWLQATPGAEVYTLGNWRAAEYPPGIPLLLLWVMLGAGTADHTLLYLPWLLLPASLAMAIWGHLRSRSAVPWLAGLAVFAWLSQPLPNIHAALAGYADLWLAAAFCFAAMALDEWQSRGDFKYGVLALVMAGACALFKVPGLALAGIVVVAAIIVAWRPSTRLLFAAVAVAACALAAGLIAGMWADPQGGGGSWAQLELFATLPTLNFRPSPLLPYLWESLFVQANWHLLWLLVLLATGLGLVARERALVGDVALLVLLAALGFVLAVFGFTHYFDQAVNGVTFSNRNCITIYEVWLGKEFLS
ncbi:MAG TPA: hypothetical protein VK972_02600, partial [Wenzhouxiangella sp.]|nr:hypothetical protein [Wenzhouxiangella sp.]